MMDNIREKLVEILKKTEINKINGHTALAEVCFTPNVFENMATNLLANGVTVQAWIPVTERLPEFCVAVLAYAKYYVSVRYEPTITRWTGDYWCDATGIRMQVTHWMPLPIAPKGE